MNFGKIPAGISNFFRQNNLGRTEREIMRTHKLKPENLSSLKPLEDSVSVSGIWARAAGEIDVRNATPREIMSLSRQLYDAGAISYDDHINLSFQPEINPDSVRESKPFSHGRKDYIALWQQRGEKVIHSGADRNQIEETHRIQAILKYVDSLG